MKPTAKSKNRTTKRRRPSPGKLASPGARARPGSEQGEKRPSGSKSSGTPIVIPPWSYSLREVKEKIRKRDGLRRRATEDEPLLMMGDVEGLWGMTGHDMDALARSRFLPTAREEDRLDRMFEGEGLSRGALGANLAAPGEPVDVAEVEEVEEPDGREKFEKQTGIDASTKEMETNRSMNNNTGNNPFGRGSYRARKSMGEARWAAYKNQEMQNSIDHVETLEERFGKRFVRECRKRVYGGVSLEQNKTAEARKEPRRESQSRVQRLNVGVPVGQVARKRPSTAEGSIKRSRVDELGNGFGNDDGPDGEWRIVAISKVKQLK